MEPTPAGLDEVEGRAEWDDLVRRHEPRARVFCCRMLGDVHQAEDVCQEALLRIYQSRERYTEAAAFSTYLYRVLSNLCINELRNRRRTVRAKGQFAALLSMHGRGTAAPNSLENLERIAQVFGCLERLPEQQRAALMLKICEEQSYAEIARVLDVTATHAAVLVYRAKKSVAAELGGKEASR
jgi:RNA polymerase sigma-70 factor, ECF subfamily